jgi:hypothetical protein
MGRRRELFAAGEVAVVSSPGVEDLGEDAEVTTAMLGGTEDGEQWLGTPRRRIVADAEILSCTAARASKEGTAVATAASSSRLLAHDSTATCSCVGNSTSKRPDR